MTETQNNEAVAGLVNEYISKEIVTNPELLPIKGDTQLIKTGILDSLSLLKVVMFLEQKFGIKVGMEDVVPENFDTIDTICSYVRSRSPK